LIATPNQQHILRRPVLLRGALAIVTNVERDAVDASSARDEARMQRTAKSCGPDTPALVSSFAEIIRESDGGKKPVTGESSKETVKTIARGRPECFR